MADLKGRSKDMKDKVVGKGKEAYGKATDDKSKETEGKAQSLGSDIKEMNQANKNPNRICFIDMVRIFCLKVILFFKLLFFEILYFLVQRLHRSFLLLRPHGSR